MSKVYVKEFNIEVSYDQPMELNMTLLFDQQIDTSILNDTEVLEAFLSKAFYGDDNGNRTPTPTEEKYLDIIRCQANKIKELEKMLKQLPKDIKVKII